MSARLVTWQGDPAVFTIFHDITEQLAAETALKASEHRLAAQSDALTFLTTRYTDPDDQFDERLRTILAISAEALDVERLSMWRFDERATRPSGASAYTTATSDQYESGSVLNARTPPPTSTRSSASASWPPRTRGPTRARASSCRAYLTPNDIGAMLDVPLRQDNTHGRRALRRTRRRRTRMDGRRAELRDLGRQSHRRRARRRRAAEGAHAPGGKRGAGAAHHRYGARRLHRHRFRGRIAAWNAQAERTFGWTRAEALGRNLAETIIPPAFRDAHIDGMRRFHETGEAPVVNQRLELTALHRAGHEFPVELTITSPMRAESGFSFGAFLRDISDRRERDDELRRAKEAAEAATRAKSEFLANMSHELRTPLNGVLGYAQLLQRDRTLNAAQREALEAISKCGSQLLDLINDVLDLSKIEAGRLDIEEAPTDLTKLLTDLHYVVAEAAEHKGLTLTMSIGADVPRRVILDGRHLRQVLLNLLGNAIKFTPAGEVRLLIARAEDGSLRFEVSDTGIGIEPEALTEIFDAFTQTKAGAAAGGTGLGLAISTT